jgi:hypothetical protein
MSANLLALILATSIVAPGVALAQPNVSDVATCNEEAQAKTGGPSAAPGPGPGLQTPPKNPAAPSLTGEKTDASGTVISGAPDPLVEGMAADRANDPVYRTAYRECMQRQTQRGRG